MKRYSHDWGAGGFLVVNLWALRSTLPEGLHECSKLEVPRDPIGTWNDYAIDLAIRQAAIGAGRVVCAWGAVAETGPACAASACASWSRHVAGTASRAPPWRARRAVHRDTRCGSRGISGRSRGNHHRTS